MALTREERNAYQREYRKKPEVKAKISSYNKRVHRERWSSMSSDERRCWNYRKLYGITLDQAIQKLASQGDVCACCKKHLSMQDAVVDHCHTTNLVRGMLCGGCNKAIGFVYEDKDTLKNMIVYLDQQWGG